MDQIADTPWQNANVVIMHSNAAADTLTFFDKDGNKYLTINHVTKEVWVRPDLSATEAAKGFWDSVAAVAKAYQPRDPK